ncbi:MAG: hypothetical protein RIB84_08510 [Sneathiellaceae bacterium]
MALSEKVLGLALTTSPQTVYAVPAGKKARILLCQVANVDGSNAATVTIQWRDASSGSPADTFRLGYQLSVAAGDAAALIAGGLILEAGDEFEALASANGDLELTFAYQEIDV